MMMLEVLHQRAEPLSLTDLVTYLHATPPQLADIFIVGYTFQTAREWMYCILKCLQPEKIESHSIQNRRIRLANGVRLTFVSAQDDGEKAYGRDRNYFKYLDVARDLPNPEVLSEPM